MKYISTEPILRAMPGILAVLHLNTGKAERLNGPTADGDWLKAAFHPMDRPAGFDMPLASITSGNTEAYTGIQARLKGEGNKYELFTLAYTVLEKCAHGQPLKILLTALPAASGNSIPPETDPKQTDPLFPYRDLIDILPTLISYVDRSLHYRLVNKAYESFFGRRVEDLVDHPISDLLSEGEILAALPFVNQALNGEAVRYEKDALRADGSLRRLDVSYMPRWGESGQVEGFFAMALDITDHHQLRLRLQESEQMFRRLAVSTRTITESVSIGLFLVNRHGHCTFLNPAAERMTGYTLNDLQDKPLDELLHPMHAADGTVSPLRAVLNGQPSVLAQEHVLCDKDGECSPVKCSATAVTDNGQLVSVVLEVKDISREKIALDAAISAYEELEKQQHLLHELFMQAPLLISIYRGPDMVCEMLNPASQSLFGWRELEGKPIFEGMPELAEQEAVGILRSVYESGEPFVGSEYPLHVVRRPGGEPELICLDLICYPTRNDEGKVDGVIILATEVTDQVLARQRVEESARQARAVLDAIPEIAWTAHPDGQVTYFNPRWYQYTGQTEEQALGMGWTATLHPAMAQHAINIWTSAVESGESYEYNILLRGTDGEYRWHMERGIPLLDNEGQVEMWVGICMDIHGQKMLAHELERRVDERTRELVQANHDLIRSNEDLEQFAYVASHDMKEPIRMISNFTSLLSSRYKGKLDREADEFISYITQGAARMRDLISDLLEYSRIGRAEEKFEAVDCNKVLELVKANLQTSLNETRTQINITGPKGKLPVVMGSQQLILQLFQNLIENAVKFHSPDRTPVLEIVSTRQDESWQFALKDNGIGIDPQYADRIFVIFQRLHSRDQYPGSGMGLSIAKKIVEYHGGRIWLQSRPGDGTTFSFTLPAVTSDQ